MRLRGVFAGSIGRHTGIRRSAGSGVHCLDTYHVATQQGGFADGVDGKGSEGER